MRNLIISTVLFFVGGTVLFAQIRDDKPIKMSGTSITANSAAKDLGPDVGSPYYNDAFMLSEVENYPEKLALRYNAYTGDMEFQQDGEVYTLLKEEYPKVLLGPQKKEYVYTPYEQNGNAQKGFLIKLNESETHPAYKSERISYTEPREAKSHYDSDKPGIYKQEKPDYFIQWNGRIREVPANKKRFAKMFGSHEKRVLDFINKNKIQLHSDTGITEISKFLDSLN